MISENESIRLIFGLKVKSLRQARNMSYQQLAEASGITLSYLHDIENGKKYPKADKILSLGKALGADYDYLVSLNGDKKIQPIIDLLSSDVINVIPWEHFGILPATLLELFSNTPDKVTAFISTLIKIARSFHLTKENFYTSALRSYQDIHDNYFEEIESAAGSFRQQFLPSSGIPLGLAALESILTEQFGITVDRKKMGASGALSQLRSYYSPSRKVLFLNKQLSSGQEAFLVARELGFQHLGLMLRPYETIVQQASSFDLLLNNFRASYFAAALLIPESGLAEDVQRIAREERWQPQLWLDLLERYNVSAEMLLQRLTNILPRHFNMDQLFFLRMSGNEEHGYEITKELHLSRLHNPHANDINEHYCRRWLAITTLQELQAPSTRRKGRGLLIEAQVSHYWQTHNRYLCLTLAKPRHKNSTDYVSVTLGLRLDSDLIQSMRFANDPGIPLRTVHTTCERCSILDCRERVAGPVFVLQQQREAEMQQALKGLDS